MRTIKRNIVFLAIAAILFVLFGLVLYLGVNRIYDLEATRQHDIEVAELASAQQNIKLFFSNLVPELLFLSGLPETKAFTESNFSSSRFKEATADMFYDFTLSHKHYYEIQIVSSSGQQVVRVSNTQDESTQIVPDADLEDISSAVYFQDALKLNPNEIYVSPMEINTAGDNTGPSLPVIRLGIPLVNSRGEKAGLLFTVVDFQKCLALLPEQIFVQTPEGYMVLLAKDGKVNYSKSDYVFDKPEGTYNVTEMESIHYSSMEYLPGKTLTVATYHLHPQMKEALVILISISTTLIVSAVLLILILGYINISRTNKLLAAQRAIIYSLAGLAEGRDPETGEHLERARQYAVILAKELHKQSRYRKFVNRDFIDNLYDAAPLHDIGKVAIPDSILLKESKLTYAEWEQMKKHVSFGRQVIENVMQEFKLKEPFLVMGRNICAYHHEKYDGAGYQEGLEGGTIPIEARIFALCDAYDAIRSKRPYKGELPHGEAVMRITIDKGKHFDPDVVDAFLNCEMEFAKIHNTYRAGGSKGTQHR
jgi:HD-GYP domain-containing protein (c-di-GMP phosphodiesterase class II)